MECVMIIYLWSTRLVSCPSDGAKRLGIPVFQVNMASASSAALRLHSCANESDQAEFTSPASWGT